MAAQLPPLGSDLAGSGKREAIRAFYEDYFTLDGDASRVADFVAAGAAPEEFKQAFRETLDKLIAAVS